MKATDSILPQLFGNVAHTYTHLFTLMYATIVLALEAEWGLSYAELFAVSIPATVLLGIGALPAGWLGDKWGNTQMMAVFFFGLGGGAILTGFMNTPLGIGIGLAVMGLFASIYHPVGIPWLIRRAVNKGRALGINGLFGSAGTGGAAIVSGFLVDYYGWRAAFFVPGAVALLTGVGFLVAVRLGIIPQGRAVEQPVSHSESADFRRVMLTLAVTVLCTGLIYQSTAFALPKLFSERLSAYSGGGILGIGGMVSVCYVASALTQLVAGELADRFRLKSIYIAAQFLQIPVIVTAFVLYNPALVLAAAMMVSLNVAGQPAENAILAKYTPDHWRGRVFGAKFILTFGVSTVGVTLIPVIYAISGNLQFVYLMLAGFAATAGIAAFNLPSEPVRRPVAAE